MNVRRLIFGSVLAGVAMFMWGSVSWMMLKWHSARTMKSEDAVKAAVAAGATEPGIYQLPGLMGPDGKMRSMEECQAKMIEGPLMIAMIRPGADKRPMASYMMGGLVCQIVLAFLLALILNQVQLPYPKLVLFSGMIGLLGALMQWLPNWNWWGYPPSDWIPYVGDSVICGLIGGAILGRFCGQKA